MKKFYFAICAISIVFGLSSCVKDVDSLPTTTVNDITAATSFSTIKASGNFNWSTTNKINLSFNGSSEAEYQLVLKVSLPDGTLLFQKLQKSNENYLGSIEVPAHNQSVIISYGSLNKTFDCKSGAVNMTIN